MNIYMEKLLSTLPRPEFDCVIISSPMGYLEIIPEGKEHKEKEEEGWFYDVIILQLGSYARHKLFSRTEYPSGEVIRCHLYKWRRINCPYVLLPLSLSDRHLLPASLARLIDI